MTDFPERLEGEDETAHLARVQAWMKGAQLPEGAGRLDSLALQRGDQALSAQKQAQQAPAAPPPLVMDAETVKALAELGSRAGSAEADLANIREALQGAADLIGVAQAVARIAFRPLHPGEGWRELCPALHRAIIEDRFAAPKEPA